ncbi:MAG: carbon-nitrogen hydrolase family protein, partial [candidate division Zixibacteria bacterium]|nr:carbon-nitrogen hydrolase family protein [candidate division Zixibacteria bacterium]
FVGRYRKLNPVDGELDRGILPGDKLFTTVVDDIKIAVLICADALNPSLFELLLEQEVDIIFIPTTSPYHPAESKSEKFKRDKTIFLSAAQTSSAFIIKTCGIGLLFQKPLQGRSLIISPWEIIKRVPTYAEDKPTILTATFDIDELREFRSKKKSLNTQQV